MKTTTKKTPTIFSPVEAFVTLPHSCCCEFTHWARKQIISEEDTSPVEVSTAQIVILLEWDVQKYLYE